MLTYKLDQCLYCRIGNPVIILENGKFPVFTKKVQHKSQPSLLISARLLQPILIGIRGFAYKQYLIRNLISSKGLIEPAFKVLFQRRDFVKCRFHDIARPGPKGYCISLALVI